MSTPTDWDSARAIIAAATARQQPSLVPLAEAETHVTVDALLAPRPLPHYDSSAMDGWAVRGAGPWTLGDGTAVPIVTGGPVPAWCDAVLPTEHAVRNGDVLSTAYSLPAGRHVRRAGDEAPAGTVLIDAGTRLRPPHLALLAVAGFDAVTARPTPSVALVFTGDEIDAEGMPSRGRVRDAFSPLLPPLVERCGGTVEATARLGDDEEAIASALLAGSAPIRMTTGGTGWSRADAVRRALGLIGATLLVDGVSMRPGHPTLIATLPDGPLVIALPGNPLAAFLAALSFLPPALDAASGACPVPLRRGVLGEALGRPGSTTLVPVVEEDGTWRAVHGIRSHMLSGLTAAEAVAVVPGAGAALGDSVRLLRLPW
ncbi:MULTISPECIES: molybdopterin molybdotransferase MoeA [unclassified Rathayibacter]|uniref:molybdopterin molybdotransferase MoeA n=1 Tax=unclassified Rathayibacter TaxID=2609250 RepID=UPI00188C7333|nr:MULTISPECIES: molybdopterin molybdotransferase MoeA [unclassified Rathayibacter]MBF4462887.1 molybdopterin molybdotransferase MoeA [Rathayibacter sp. VKM Ac-2879]MBF4504301.1 molybdopterin molybdotransferase MoeA [Rathayibacter sp. VKM Ac-2878]